MYTKEAHIYINKPMSIRGKEKIILDTSIECVRKRVLIQINKSDILRRFFLCKRIYQKTTLHDCINFSINPLFWRFNKVYY